MKITFNVHFSLLNFVFIQFILSHNVHVSLISFFIINFFIYLSLITFGPILKEKNAIASQYSHVNI